MIFIVGEDFEVSTFRVIDYLNHYGTDYVKINRENILENIHIEISESKSDVVFNFDQKKIELSKISSYWYRRGDIRLDFHMLNENIDEISCTAINRYLLQENYSVINFVNHWVEKTAIKIGASSKSQTDKLVQLMEAYDCGIDIPQSFIFSEKSKLLSLINKYDEIATKGIKKTFSEKGIDGKWYSMTTSIIDKNNIHEVPDTFFPTLFQVYLKKKYELRIFFFHENFYPMAIFSQTNSKTKVDFRNYDSENPNRTVPILLPLGILEKLKKLNKILGLDTGSIDMILTTDNRYVFLEVNPDGQFGMVSFPCNYLIERNIAKTLSQNE